MNCIHNNECCLGVCAQNVYFYNKCGVAIRHTNDETTWNVQNVVLFAKFKTLSSIQCPNVIGIDSKRFNESLYLLSICKL